MELNEYRKKCSAVSVKLAIYGAWWAVKWEDKNLVKHKDSLYIPYAISFRYIKGKEYPFAILHDLRSNTEYNVPLEEVENNADSTL